MDKNEHKKMRTCHVCSAIFKSNYEGETPTCFHCTKAFFVKENVQVRSDIMVIGGGRFADARSHALGLNAEMRFATICQKKHMLYRPATKVENMKHHFDFVVKVNPNTYYRIDVKSMKARRRGEAPDPSIIYVELKDVNGCPGWVYGHADFIAFEQKVGFMLVPRDNLVNFVEKVQPTCKTVTRSGVPYTLYTRMGRSDLILTLPYSDVARLASPIADEWKADC